MSRFKRIKNKTTKKSSVSIDEKIAALNKELGKTGMLSEITNSTDGVYSTSTYVPPQQYIEADVPDSSGILGGGFTQSSAGSGVEGDAPNHSSVSDLFNDTVNATIFPSTEYEGKQGYGIVIGPSFGAGTSFGIIEEGNTYRGILGGFLAGGTRGSAHYKEVLENKISAGRPQEEIDDAEEHYQLAVQVEAALIKIGYDTTLFNVTWKAWRRPILFEDLSMHPSYDHPEKGRLYLTGFSMLGTRNRYAEQDARRETTTNPQRRGLEDDPIYPGAIPPGLFPPMSEAGFNWLRNRARGGDGSDSDDPKTSETDKGEDDGPLVHGMTQEEVERRYGHYDDDQLGRLHIKRLPDGSYREMTQAEIDAFNKYYGKKVLGDLAYKVGLAYRNVHFIFDKIMPLGKSIDQILKGDSGYDKLDAMIEPIIEKIGKYAGRKIAKGKYETSANVMFRYDKWLAGGARGTVDVTNEISSKEMKKLKKDLLTPGGFTPDRWVEFYMKKSATNPNPSKTREEALSKVADDVQGRIQQVMTQAGTGLSMTFHNNVKLNKAKYIASGGKIVEMTKTYKFSEKTGSTKSSSKSVLGRLIHGLGLELDRFGTGGVQNSIISLLGAKYGLAAVNRNYGGKADSAPGMPMKFTVSSGISESVGSFTEYMNSTNLLTEGVGLGLYEPEAMNVDLADIRKGVMPEYPKKPPAEMIDGYHQDSKLKPKEFKDKYLLKIDEKDLLRSHRLKRSEVDEMMNTVKMINDHLKKHPEDLIYAQQRYPVDDKRLAVLNWKMDQMLEAGKEYLDKNFKENQTLYKRATDRTRKNIKLTDPKYVQRHYDELRGTTKPKKTKLVGRLGKHLNKYESKSFFKHVNSKDFRKTSERILEKKKFLEKQEQKRLDYINDINAEMDEFRSDWRKDISESDFTNITTGNKIGQTFQHTSGATITLDATMGDTSMIPSQVTLDLGGDEKITVDAPSENEYGLTGVTKPLDKKVMQKQSVKTAKEINDQLDASEKASESKSARVPIETGDLGYKSTDQILAEVGDQWTYEEYMDQLNALSDRYAKIAEPLEKVKLDYIYNKREDVPIEIVDAIDAITKALHQAQEALHQAWERYNKVPDLPDGGEEPIAKSRRSNYTPQEIAQNRENLKNSIITTATGVIDGARNLNRVNYALNLAKRQSAKSGGSTQINTIPSNSLGGRNNPVETKMHFQSKKAFIKSVDLNNTDYDIASQIVDNSADAAQYALGFKAVHSQIPTEGGSQENNVKLNSKGDLEMFDNYAFRPDGYMDTGIAKAAKFFGGTELQKDAATLLDKAGPVGWLSHALLGDIPDRQDPPVRIKTTITKKELIKILGAADYKIFVNRMKKEKKKRKVNESTAFSKIKRFRNKY